MRTKTALPATVALLLAGCGGSRILGSNSNVDLLMDQNNNQDLELVVAPNQGRESHPQACNATSNGFGCSRDLQTPVHTYRFTTGAGASDDPYHVYVLNKSSAAVSTQFEAKIDGQTKIQQIVTIPPKTSALVAKVHRNNVQNLVSP